VGMMPPPPQVLMVWQHEVEHSRGERARGGDSGGEAELGREHHPCVVELVDKSLVGGDPDTAHAPPAAVSLIAGE